jgi:hypothetical protein
VALSLGGAWGLVEHYQQTPTEEGCPQITPVCGVFFDDRGYQTIAAGVWRAAGSRLSTCPGARHGGGAV